MTADPADDLATEGARSVPQRPRRPSLTNEQLLDKAFELFVAHGLERTGIEMIAAQADMAKRTVYLRYGDRYSLFKAPLARAIERWIVPIERLRETESDDPGQRRRCRSSRPRPAGSG